MGEVVDFTGETLSDIEPDQILESAKGKMSSLILIGELKDGEYYWSSSTFDIGAILLDLKKLEHYLIKYASEDG